MSIGLASSFRELAQHTVGGRPVLLYVTGQTCNLVLTLLAAYLAFGGILFDRVAAATSPVHATHVIPHNIATGRDATALFYTEVEGWRDWITEERSE